MMTKNADKKREQVMLIKISFIQYLYGIKSMRQTMKEIEVNVPYRWFLGLHEVASGRYHCHLCGFYPCKSLCQQ